MARHGSVRGLRRGSGLRPAAGGGCGFFRGIQPCFALRCFSVGLSYRSLPCFPTLPCCASRHIHAAPSGASMLCLSALPCASARGGRAGRRGVRGGFGDRGVAGSRAGERLWGGMGVGGATAGEWAEPTAGGAAAGCGFGIYRGIQRGCAFRPFSASPAAYLCCALWRSHALCLRHIHTAPFGASVLSFRGLPVEVPVFPRLSVSGLVWTMVRGFWRGAQEGRRRRAGRGTLGAWQGSGRGPRQGSG